MIKSMTAFGKGLVENELGRIQFEIQSINRKFLDVNVNLPRELSEFESEIREWLKPYLFRGQVQVKVNYLSQSSLPAKIVLNVPLVEEYRSVFATLVDKLQINSVENELLKFLLQQPQIFIFESLNQGEKIKELLKDAFILSINDFQKMREQEGNALYIDLCTKLQLIQNALDQIIIIAEKAPNKYKEKLIQRIKEVSVSSEITDARIILEVALFADKIDVSEEITRFQSHISQFYQFMKSEEGKGKTLEFLLQEMFREVNTMSVKIGDLKGVQLCISIKSELEKIREQVQNIE